MLETILMLCHATVLLLFGVFLSASFAGILLTKKNVIANLIFSAVCLALQGILLALLDETTVKELYPLITHFPLLLLLTLYYKKALSTALISISTAYLCCQPAKWFGILTHTLSQSEVLSYVVQIVVLLIVYLVTTVIFSRAMSKVFSSESKAVYTFIIIPLVYYIFDYTTVVYTDIWETHNAVAVEFMPFFVSIMFIAFCILYCREYEEKFEAAKKEEIIRLTVEQQAKELEAFRRSENEIRVLRHDLRLFLSTLAVCIETDDKSVVQDMIRSYSEHVDGTKIQRYCTNDTVNYVLSDFMAKCKASDTEFLYKIEIGNIRVNTILFSSILSNALDNALHAVEKLPKGKRTVTLMLKEMDGKLLLSIKNPILKAPDFVDGLPVSTRKGHGYGTRSIRYLTEKLGGNSQFSVKDSVFVTRIIL